MRSIANIEIVKLEGRNRNQIKDSLLRNYIPILKFESKIICAEWICGNIIKEFDKESFEEYITSKLRKYFITTNANRAKDDGLLFSVVTDESSMKDIPLNPTEEISPPYVLYTIASISGLLIMVGLFAFIFNKMPNKCSKIPGFNVVDDGKWMSMVIFALQFWYTLYLFL